MDSTVALLIQMIGFPLFMFLVSLLCVYDYKRRMTDKPWNDKTSKKEKKTISVSPTSGDSKGALSLVSGEEGKLSLAEEVQEE